MTIKMRPMILRAALAVFISIASIFTGAAALQAADPVAFPGAEGFGAIATGGRGGTVYIVTNLKDSGAGSFRDAVSQSNRIVVFAVGGVININSAITVSSNITIAGQTAPGEGIAIYGNTVAFKSNVICRYIRIHGSINMPSANYTLSAGGMVKGIFDHVSVLWGRWDNMKLDSLSTDISFQYCLIGEAILPQKLGALFELPKNITVHHSLWINNKSRNPKAKAYIEYINNVVYNWGSYAFVGGHSSANSYQDIIANYFLAGPDSTSSNVISDCTGTDHVYQRDNFLAPNRNGTLTGRFLTNADVRSSPTIMAQPYHTAPNPVPVARVTIDTAEEALYKVIAKAGASKRRDAVDTRLINQVKSYGTQGSLIARESDVGGQPPMTGGIPAKDTNTTGIPDWWAEAMGFGSAATSVWANTVRADGYTQLENYINSIVTAGPAAADITGITPASGTAVTDPFTGGSVTASQQFSIHGTAAPGATVEVSRVDTGALGTATADASGNWTYDYTSTTLSERYYAFTARVQQDAAYSIPAAAYAVHVKTTPSVAPDIKRMTVSPAQTFTGTADPYATVNVFIQGNPTPVATGAADGYGNWAATTTETFLLQTYTFEASAMDLAGLTTALSTPFDVDMSIPTPAFTDIDPDTGVSNSDQITSAQNLTIYGTARTGDNVKIYYLFNDSVTVVPVGSPIVDPAGVWTLDYTAVTLAEGTYTFMATADIGGTPSPMSPPFIVTIDRTRPVVSSIRRSDPDTTNTTSATLVFRVTFAEPVIGVIQDNFSVTRSGSDMAGNITGFAQIDASTYTVTVTGAAGDGTIRVDLKANATNIQDLAGNQCTAAFTSGQTYTMRYVGSSVWDTGQDDQDGAWSNIAAWEDGVIADGNGATADFNTVDIVDETVVTLDTSRTLGRLVFGDADEDSPGTWRVASGAPGATITLANPTSTQPEIKVIYATDTDGTKPTQSANGAKVPVTIDTQINTTTGLLKTGWGTLILKNTGTFSGPINITEGRLVFGPGSNVNMTSTVTTLNSGGGVQLIIAGGTFATTGNTNIEWRSDAGIYVTGGRADFNRIIPGNIRNGEIRVSGGILNVSEFMMARNSDSSISYASGLLISGGTSTFGILGLGTVDSWGTATISGGKLVVTDAFWIGYQTGSARGGGVRVQGGEVVATGATNGIVLSRKNGTNANNVATLAITGGTVTAKRIALGYDNQVNAGSQTLTLDGANAALYLGSVGLVRNSVSPATATVNLTNGTLGADEDWSTTVPMVVNGGAITIKAADAANVAHDITLGGVLSNSGAITKTGAGTLTLSAANSHTGPITVNAGTLNVTGLVAASAAAPVTINVGATLAGTGTISRSVVLNGGGFVAAGTPITITGALTKQGAGPVPLVLAPAFAAQSGIPVATFASTNLTAADFDPIQINGESYSVTVTGTAILLTLQEQPEEPSYTPPDLPEGITGGGSDATPVVVSTAADLKAALAATDPAVVVVSGQIDLTATGPVTIASNKTILGQNDASTILGSVTIPAGASNIVIIGVNITNPVGSGLVLDGASDIYINHCTFHDCNGPLVSVINGAANVTLSWNEFYFSPAFAGANRMAMQIGTFDETGKTYAVTLHHNHWMQGCADFMPLALAGQVHMYDNYLYATSNSTATIVSGPATQMLSENNVYRGMLDPIVAQDGGLLAAIGNTYNSTTGATVTGTDTVFVPAYQRVLETSGTLTANIPAYAGNTGGAASVTPAGVDGTVTILNPGVPVPNGGTFMLAAAVTGVTPSSYKWNLNNFAIPGATGSTYTVTNAKAAANAGAYSISVGLATGQTIVSGASIVTIGESNAPVIITQPVSQTVRLGDRATFVVTATSNTPMRYQWYMDGVIIPFATNPVYYVDTTKGFNGGSYYVTITNDDGSVTSDHAALTIEGYNPGSASGGGGDDGGGGAPSWWLLGAGALLMIIRYARKIRGAVCAVALLFTALFAATDARAADGTWANTSGGNWGDSANWTGGAVASGVGSAANFTNAGDKTVTVNAPVTVGTLNFDGGNWTIATSGAGNTLMLEVAASNPDANPFVSPVINAPDATTVTISGTLAGTQGFTKTGSGGTIILSGTTTINGHILMSSPSRSTSGTMSIVSGGYLNLGSGNFRILGGWSDAVGYPALEIDGGTFITTGMVIAGATGTFSPRPSTYTSGTSMNRMVIKSGYVNIGEFRTASDSRGTLLVTGGTLIADYINIERSGGSFAEVAYGFLAEGGYVEANRIGIATNNSHGSMTVRNSGTVLVRGDFTVSFQSSSTRGGTLIVEGGRLTSEDTVNGLVLGRQNGTVTNTQTKLLISGGVTTVEKITLGYDETMATGTFTGTMSGGALYIGTGGIVKNGASGYSTTLTLSGGTLGAKGDWSTTLPITLTTNPVILASSEDGAARNITLGGVLGGTGGFTKEGAGILTLAATGTFTGTATVNAGTLKLDASPTNAVAGIVLNASGTLASTIAAVNCPIVFNGGSLDLTASTLPLAIASINKLDGSGPATIIYAGAAPTEGNDITLVTFTGPTNLTAADFSPIYVNGVRYSVVVADSAIRLTLQQQSSYTPPGLPEGITGGGVAPVQAVTTPGDFKTAVEADGPAAIVVEGVIDLSSLGGAVNVASDKTIAGNDENAILSGQLKIASTSTNVVIAGLNVTNPAGSGLVIDGGQDVYVTHCSFFDCGGPLVSIINGADNVTLAWNEFHYTNDAPAGPHSAMQIGKVGAETKPLRVALHHNYFGEGCAADMPVSNNGHVHMYDNYLNAPGNTTATIVAANSQMLSEGNVYQDMAAPFAKTGGGLLRAFDNIYVNTTGAPPPPAGEDVVFVPDYSRLLETPETIGADVPLYAGNWAGIGSLPPEPSVTGRIGIVATGTALPTGGGFTLIATVPGLRVQSSQWYLNNLPIDGATNAAYAITNATDMDAGPYSIGMTLPTGETLMSAAVHVTVGTGAAPTIVVQPASVVIARQNTAIFGVVAKGDGELKYQWRKNGVSIAGATSPSLSLASASDADQAAYSVTVSNDYGTVTSADATLTLRDAAGGGNSDSGGGAPSWWLLGALAALTLLRVKSNRRR